jgi:hypothetical protein
MGTAAATNAFNALKYFMIASYTLFTERGAVGLMAAHRVKAAAVYLAPPKVAGSCLSKTIHVGCPNFVFGA